MRGAPKHRAAVSARRSPDDQQARHRAQKVSRRQSIPNALSAASVSAGLVVMGIAVSFASPQGLADSSPTAAPAESPPTPGAPKAILEAAEPTPSQPLAGDAALDRRRERVSRGGGRSQISKSEPAQPAPDADPDWLRTCRSTPADGGSANGRIPDENLCEVDAGPLHLRSDAAAAFWRLAEAYETRFGSELCVTDGYRSLVDQERLYAAKPGLAARPGTSNHGWGIAVDLCGGVESFDTEQHIWLAETARDFGWSNPEWAQATGSKPEPWHWEYGD